MKYIYIVFVLFCFVSCKEKNSSLNNERKIVFNNKNNISNLITTWYEVKQRSDSYILSDCGYEGRWLKIKKDSIYEHGIMEDSHFGIYKIIKNDNEILLYINEMDFYSISWVDKLKKIINIKSEFYGNINRYYVSKGNLKKIQKNGADCIENISFEENKSIDGNWKTNCDNLGTLEIKEKKVFIELNSNQVYIDALLDKKNDSIYNILLKAPNDLGAGGMRLDWGNFSKDSIIARINYSKKRDFIIFNWLGFYNDSIKKREWVENSEFQLQSEILRDIKLIRCNK